MVGIIYLVGDKLFIDSTPLSGAGHYADHLIHDRGHDEYWSQLVKMGAVPSGDTKSSHEDALLTATRVANSFSSLTFASCVITRFSMRFCRGCICRYKTRKQAP